ncbi:hypothetical protein H109_04025 [Trichophyton interdigitale MR816]|uniref:Uncharacterized protein n=1 Tax=Trichophyton interdigitale (strain MR816) TaxID=1215338 RepID=A0A059J8A5_TRIIM|nr:hypothetical protein H101_02005 [Trichophyton interdigitale H6]KDB24080.1 hypothetical protein H109_04025 [Trichophyton interdigitale MR816]
MDVTKPSSESLDGFLNPVGAGGIFTVSKLLIISMFPPDPRGWQAGFSKPSLKQGGKSTCLPLTALVASRVTQHSRVRDKLGLGALLILDSGSGSLAPIPSPDESRWCTVPSRLRTVND